MYDLKVCVGFLQMAQSSSCMVFGFAFSWSSCAVPAWSRCEMASEMDSFRKIMKLDLFNKNGKRVNVKADHFSKNVYSNDIIFSHTHRGKLKGCH